MPGPHAVRIELTDVEWVIPDWLDASAGKRASTGPARATSACLHRGCAARPCSSSRVSTVTVGKWRTRFAANRLAGLSNSRCPGRPRTICDAVVDALVMRTPTEPPTQGDTRWTSRSMGAGVRNVAVRRARPGPVVTWQSTTGPRSWERLRAVVGVCLDPRERPIAQCVAGTPPRSTPQHGHRPAPDRRPPVPRGQRPATLLPSARPIHSHGSTGRRCTLSGAPRGGSSCVFSPRSTRRPPPTMASTSSYTMATTPCRRARGCCATRSSPCVWYPPPSPGCEVGRPPYS